MDNKSQYTCIMLIISPFIILKTEKPISLRNNTHLNGRCKHKIHINNNNSGQEVMLLISLSSDTNDGRKSVSIAQTKNIWLISPDEHTVIGT